jgi:hypothetical protein
MTHRWLPIALATSLVVSGVALAAPAFAAAPTVTSFTPSSAKSYSTVTITGTGFSTPATARFNGVAATATTVKSTTSITATVPPTASTGKVSVTTSGGTATSTATFTVLAGVHLTVTSGPPTTRTTVSMSGFAPSEAVDLSFDTTALRTLVTDSGGAASVALPVPTSAAPGTHTFTAVGRRSGTAARPTVRSVEVWTFVASVAVAWSCPSWGSAPTISA